MNPRRSLPWLAGRPRTLEILSPPFRLEHTLTSGQCFRWCKRGRGFLGIVSGYVLCLEQKGSRLLYRSFPPGFAASRLRTYLGLDGVHAAAVRSFPGDPILLRAVKKFRGMRLLRQDPYETLISFIISSNNNIKRIRSCIERLCRTFGEEIEPGSGFHAFPPPEELADAPLRTLRGKCNLGYRDRYVRDTAREIARTPQLLSEIARLPYREARKAIMQLPGVGRKVADCVLLYSMEKWEAFPVDTWIRKTVQDNYFGGKRVSDSTIATFARQHFGPFAGYAQLYLFHYARTAGV